MSDFSEHKIYLSSMELRQPLSSYGSDLTTPLTNLVSINVENFAHRQSDASIKLRSLAGQVFNQLGIATDISFFSPVEKNLVPSTATQLPSEMFYAFTLSPASVSNTTEIASLAQAAMMQVLQTMSKLYEDLLSNCKDVMEAIDIGDPEVRDEAVERLKDVLGPFHSVLGAVFSGLLAAQKSQPVAISFLLSQVLPSLDNVDVEVKLAIVRSVLVEAKPSVRFVAMQALDDIGVAQAKQLMASVYPNETNRLIRSLINSSLQAG